MVDFYLAMLSGPRDRPLATETLAPPSAPIHNDAEPVPRRQSLRLGKSAGVGQKRLDGGDGCSSGGYNQLQQRVWRLRVRPSLGALLPRPNRSELLNYFLLEFVQGFRAGHSVIIAEILAQIKALNRAVIPPLK